MTKTNSIYLVEDHVIVRNGMKGLLENMGNYKVTGEYDHGKQLIDALNGGGRPDLIIMDLNMPVMDGKTTMEWLKHHKILLPVLILTLDVTDKTIIQLYRAGVRGYLAKTCTAETLKKAIDDILTTGYFHNELLTNALLAVSVDQEIAKDNDANSHITERERDFLNLVCAKEEYTYDQMATRLGVSTRTIDGYRQSLFLKFDVKSKTGLVLYAIQHGLITI